MTALAKGFLSTSHPEAVLQLCSDSALSVSIAKAAIEELFQTIESKRDVIQVSKPCSFKYEFAFSFAGEQRGFVEQICLQLKSNGVSVFYDNDEQGRVMG